MTTNSYQMQNPWIRALIVQGRVIYALILRETRTMYGRSMLGYLWVVLTMVFQILLFWGLRAAFRSMDPYGISLPMFLLCGFSTLHIFMEAMTKCKDAVNGNLGLLYFPQVEPIDLYLSRVILLGATKVLAFFILAVIIDMLGYPVYVNTLQYILTAWTIAALMGMGFGIVLGSLSRYIASVDNIMPLVQRIIFFTSGVFYSFDNLPPHAQNVMQYNPVFQCVELTRSSFSPVYFASFASYSYLVSLTMIFIVIGLISDRMTRHKRDLI
jgi:capsular polysaccharide transport system permease protein